MKLFLTSDMGESYKKNGVRVPCALDGSNHLLELFKEHLPVKSKLLIISSDPENEIMNDSFKKIFAEAFEISGFPLSKADVCGISVKY